MCCMYQGVVPLHDPVARVVPGDHFPVKDTWIGEGFLKLTTTFCSQENLAAAVYDEDCLIIRTARASSCLAFLQWCEIDASRGIAVDGDTLEQPLDVLLRGNPGFQNRQPAFKLCRITGMSDFDLDEQTGLLTPLRQQDICDKTLDADLFPGTVQPLGQIEDFRRFLSAAAFGEELRCRHAPDAAIAGKLIRLVLAAGSGEALHDGHLGGTVEIGLIGTINLDIRRMSEMVRPDFTENREHPVPAAQTDIGAAGVPHFCSQIPDVDELALRIGAKPRFQI